ncbi:MAG: M56 family metallopeptidase [Clostridia bacterium]|nr:M56 family metallopeptidase [Clostridia bacterium]
MSDLFLHVFKIAVTAGWIAAACLLLRVILRRRLAGWVRCVLWGLVGVRLLFPFSLESVLSLIPSAETVPPTITTAPAPQINVGLPVVDEVINPVISQTMAPVPEYSVNPMQVVVAVAAAVWLVGVAVMLTYYLVSAIRLRRRLAVNIPYGENIYLCDHLPTSILVGILRPRIYIPSDTDPSLYPHILAHERNHMARGDHIWKPLSFLLLSVYWFHPLLWVAYILLGRDMEQACDEKTAKGMSEAELEEYLHALVACSDRKPMGTRPGPVGFGETKIFERVKHMLNYKQPKLWITLASVVLILVVAVCFLTNPVSAKEPNEPTSPPAGEGTTLPTPPNEPGTEHPATPALTPPGGVPSEEFQTELAEAFLQKYGVAWTYRYAEGDATYYGAYRDYAVLFVAESMGPYNGGDFYCGRYRFGYHMEYILAVYRGGDFYHLNTAYENGWITDAELKSIWEAQNLTNGRYVEPDPPPAYDTLPAEAILARVGALSEDMILTIKTDYLSRYPSDYYGISSLRLCYYGEFNGAIAFIMDGLGGYPQAVYKEKIGGVLFSYSCHRTIAIYHNGSFYSLQGAYEKGLLTMEDLRILRENYIVVECHD